MIRNLLFDFGSTLDGPVYWLDRFSADYQAAGINISRNDLDLAYQHASAQAKRASAVVARFGFTELARMLVGQQIEFLAKSGSPSVREALKNLDAHRRHRVLEDITARFVKESRAGMERGRALLAKLKARYRLGVVSNWYGNLDRVLAEAGMSQFLGAIVDSSQFGFSKPDPRIFLRALKLLDAKPGDSAMVGDSLEKDCVPAHALGLTTILFRPCSTNGVAHMSGAATPDYIVASLEEVAELPL